MYNIKKVFIFIAVVVLIALIAGSFVGEDLVGRAIIIGLGIDTCEEGVRVTAEIVSPASSGEQIGTFSKTVSADGKSLATAISRIAELTGKEASLGRCLIVIFGQNYYEQRDLSNEIEFLIMSDSFKESSVICCAEGSAEEMFNKGAAMSQGVSLTLSSMFKTQTKQTAIVTNTLLQYTLSQRSLLKTGYMNQVRFIPSNNVNTNEPDKAQGYFDLRNIAIFGENKYMCMLSDTEIRGLALLNADVIGSTFVCTEDDKQLTVTINSKNIGLSLNQDDTVKCKIELMGKVVRTDSGEVEGPLVSQDTKDLSPQVIEDIVKQATEDVNALLEKQREYNFDVVKLHETFRRKNGDSKQLDELATADIKVELNVTFKEK